MVAVRLQPLLEVDLAVEGVHCVRVRDSTEQKSLQAQFSMIHSLM